jgi:hypothetical protein
VGKSFQGTIIIFKNMLKNILYSIALLCLLLPSCKRDEMFEVYDPKKNYIRVKFPTTHTVNKNETYDITWESDIEDNIRIELYKKDNIVLTISAKTANNGTFSWTVPSELMPDSLFRLRLVNVNNSNVSGFSRYFSISGDSTVKTIKPVPFAFNNWIKGNDSLIQWIDNIEEDVKIELYFDGAFVQEIISLTPSNGSYLWSVPANLQTHSKYQIKIISIEDPAVYGISDYLRISETNEVNLIKNGQFNTQDHWIISNPEKDPKYRWNIFELKGNGAAETITLQASGNISQNAAFVNGQQYQVTYTLSPSSNGYFGGGSVNLNQAGIICKIGNGTGFKRTQPGTYTEIITADSQEIRFEIFEFAPLNPNKGFICRLDNIEVIAL